MDFFDQVGTMAIGSRLRRLADRVAEQAEPIYALYDVGLHPKWFPVFQVLTSGERTITAIAQEIGHSHPSVSRTVAEMQERGVVAVSRDELDGRRTLVSLTEEGREQISPFADQSLDVASAVDEMLGEGRHDLWEALAEWEYMLDRESLADRVKRHRKVRERSQISIVDYEPHHAEAFRLLNEEWIVANFTMEEADRLVLENPDTEVLAKGGRILMALLDGEPVGTCALLAMDDPDYDFELVKMAVSPAVRGRGVGRLLAEATLERARSLGARAVYLESNTSLKPAIALYHALGFRKVVGHATPYARCNIQMVLRFGETDEGARSRSG